MKRNLIPYSMQIAMLKQLLSISLITEQEFRTLIRRRAVVILLCSIL